VLKCAIAYCYGRAVGAMYRKVWLKHSIIDAFATLERETVSGMLIPLDLCNRFCSSLFPLSRRDYQTINWAIKTQKWKNAVGFLDTTCYRVTLPPPEKLSIQPPAGRLARTALWTYLFIKLEQIVAPKSNR
jgi:hypothetical protein